MSKMEISENALELLQILQTEKINVNGLQKRTKWVKNVLEQSLHELHEKKYITSEGCITNEGSEILKKYGEQQKEFNVNINAFNTKWG